MMGNTKPASSGGVAKEHCTLWRALVWAYRQQCVDVALRSSLYEVEAIMDGETVVGRSSDGVAAVMERGQLGAFGDTGGFRLPTGDIDCHEDAVKLHYRVLELAEEEKSILIRYANKGEQPEPSDVQPMPMPVHPDLMHPDKTMRDKYGTAIIRGHKVLTKLASAGRVQIDQDVYDRRGRKRVVIGTARIAVEVEYSPIEWWPALEVLEMNNYIHRTFVSAMKRLWPLVQTVEFDAREITEIGFEVDEVTPTLIPVPKPAPRERPVIVDITPAVADSVDWSGPAPKLMVRHARVTGSKP